MGTMTAAFSVAPENHLHRHPEAQIEWVMGIQSGICLEQLAFTLFLWLIRDGIMGNTWLTQEYFADLNHRYYLKTRRLQFDCHRPLLRGPEFSVTLQVNAFDYDIKQGVCRGLLADCTYDSPAFNGTVRFFTPTPEIAKLLPRIAANRQSRASPKATESAPSPSHSP